MIKVFQYSPAWNLPDTSPFVTKLVNYLVMTGLEYEMIPQPIERLQEDAPHGKLPYIIDDDGTKVADSSAIILYLKDKYGDPLDGDLTREQKAQALAWNRLIEEHLFWSGLMQIRWREDKGWETYVPFIAGGGEVSAELRAGLDQFREMIKAQVDGQGMGRRSNEEVYELAKIDLQAISDFLGDKPYFLGDEPHAIDASLYSFLMHILYVPFESAGKDFGLSKKNLVDYCTRMHDRYGI